ELSTGFEHPEGLLERLSVQTVQDHIAVAQVLFEAFFLVVDHDIRPEAFHEVDVRRTRRRSHDRTDMLRKLNGERSHAARARVDQDYLSLDRKSTRLNSS